jgi:hypothetical protein
MRGKSLCLPGVSFVSTNLPSLLADRIDLTDPTDSWETTNPFKSLIVPKTYLRRHARSSAFLFSQETELYVVYSAGEALALSAFRRKVFSVMNLFKKIEISCRNQVYNLSGS